VRRQLGDGSSPRRRASVQPIWRTNSTGSDTITDLVTAIRAGDYGADVAVFQCGWLADLFVVVACPAGFEEGDRLGGFALGEFVQAEVEEAVRHLIGEVGFAESTGSRTARRRAYSNVTVGPADVGALGLV
jgi:hypothetical protein